MALRFYWGLSLLVAAELLGAVTPAIADPTTVNANADTSALTSERSSSHHQFVLENYAIVHQGHHQVTITMAYRLDAIGSSPTPGELQHYIDSFLQTYPNETDYWELVNRNLVIALINTYQSLIDVTLELAVAPCESFPHQRGSIVQYISQHLHEHWYFAMPVFNTNALVEPTSGTDQPLLLRIDYDYQSLDGLTMDYPDYRAILDYLQAEPIITQGYQDDVSLQPAIDRIQLAFPMVHGVTMSLQ